MTVQGKHILVTGGAGFIGSELVRLLAGQQARITVIDNLINGRRENIANIPGGQVQLVVSDIRDTDAMGKIVRDVDAVFHLACLGVRHSIHSPVENHEVNATGTLNLLAAARAEGVERFVYVSTSEVYGTARRVPMTEEHPTFPMTVYGASKLAGESYTRAYYRTYGFPAVVVRPFNAYGPRCHHEGDSGEVIPRFLLRCMAGLPMVVFGDGTQTRDFTFVWDTARGILLAGLSDDAVGETINIGSGFEVSINDLAHHVSLAVGRPDAPVTHEQSRPGDVLRHCADIRKARDLLEFETQIPFHEGLAVLKDWYNSCGQSPEQLLQNEVTHNWKQPGKSAHAS